VVITSCAPSHTFKSAGIKPHKPPNRAAASRAKGTWITEGKSGKEIPTRAAAKPPISS